LDARRGCSKDFLDHLLWEARIDETECSQEVSTVKPEVVDQLERYHRTYGPCRLVPIVDIDLDGLTRYSGSNEVVGIATETTHMHR
jgi:hypothetical protein